MDSYLYRQDAQVLGDSLANLPGAERLWWVPSLFSANCMVHSHIERWKKLYRNCQLGRIHLEDRSKIPNVTE